MIKSNCLCGSGTRVYIYQELFDSRSTIEPPRSLYVQVYCLSEYLSVNSDYSSYTKVLSHFNFSYHVIDNRYLIIIGGLYKASDQ